MKLGQKKRIDGELHQVSGFRRNGEPIYRKLEDGKPSKIMGRPPSFALYQPCRVLIPGVQELEGMIIELNPVRAIVTTQDPLWKGCEVKARNVRARE